MEPSIISISIEREIKFQKSELEPLKYSTDDSLTSEDYRVCNIANVRYFLSINVNAHEEEGIEQTSIYLGIIIGNATKVDVDCQIVIESTTYSCKIENTYDGSLNYNGNTICSTSDFFDEQLDYFVEDVLTVKVKGIFTINFPPTISYPISAKWSIKQSDLERLKSSNNGLLASKIYKLHSHSNIMYHLKISPNGNRENRRGKAWIFFELWFGKDFSKIEAVLNYKINSANYSVEAPKIRFRKSKYYATRICSTEELFNPENSYFVDGKLTITLSGSLLIEKKKAKRAIAKSEATIVNATLLPDCEKNFTIVVKDEHIRVHKHILEAASPYFIGMFNSGMTEATEMKMNIKEFSYDVVEAGIKLLYKSSEVPTNFTFEQMLDLFRFSDIYQIQLIKDLIQEFFIENLSPTNVCPLINFITNTVSAPKLLAKCQEYLIKSSKESRSINALETLDKDLMVKLFMETFVHNF